MSDIETQIQTHIEKFVVELSALVRQAAIAAVTDAFGSGGEAVRPPDPAPKSPKPRAPKARAATRAAAPRPKKSTPSPRAKAPAGQGNRRSPKVMKKQRDALAAYIEAHPGELMENIAKALRSSSKSMNRPVAKLIADGVVHRVGAKRASRYYPGPADAKKKTAKKKTAKK